MTSLAASERAQLSALADQVGPDAATLCEGWTVRDLVVHLLVREGSPTGLAALGGPLGAAARRVLPAQDAPHGSATFPDLVDALRNGPPRLSPFSLPGIDALVNSVELFVHHEDVRRAQPGGWTARVLPAATEQTLWRSVKVAGRALTLRSPVAVEVERTDTGETARLHGRQGARGVVVRGLPSELMLHLFGRTGHTDVEVDGAADDVAAFSGARLGI